MWVRGGSDQMTYWDFASANTFEEVKPQDADNGMIAMFGNYLDSKGHLYSAKISLDGLTKPTLTFYLFNLVDPAHADDNTVEVYIKGSAEKDFSKIETYTLSDFKNRRVAPCGNEPRHMERPISPSDVYRNNQTFPVHSSR